MLFLGDGGVKRKNKIDGTGKKYIGGWKKLVRMLMPSRLEGWSSLGLYPKALVHIWQGVSRYEANITHEAVGNELFSFPWMDSLALGHHSFSHPGINRQFKSIMEQGE